MISKLTSRIPTRSGLLRHSVAWFLGALVFMFVTAPFVEEMPNGGLVEAVLLTVVLGAAVLAVGGRRQTLIVASVLVVPVGGARWLHHFSLHDGTYLFHITAFLVFMGFVVFHFLRFILRSPRVNSEVLCAAVATYLLLGLLWATAYALVAQMVPGSFTGVAAGRPPLHGFDALYFSLITLTTVGYGYIAPVSGPARMLAMMEAVTGTMYMAVLVARLVSGFSFARSAAEETRPPGQP
ncbi:MAG: potassium channel family protein [Verrucomicrobiota bacterium]